MTPKTKRNIARIIPYGIIWLLTGWYNLSIESLTTNNINYEPDSRITLTFSIFIFASIAVTLVGIVVGVIEVILLDKLFINKSFFKKILYKYSLYFIVLHAIIFFVYPFAVAIEYSTSLGDPIVWQKLNNFSTSKELISTSISLSFSLFLCLIYSGISENVGYRVFLNLITGKYQEPKEEKRIFLFLDMKSSTAIAEKLGHKVYFKFLQNYYHALSNSIIQQQGEIYQYIGDEVVISWNVKDGLKNNNCIQCFFKMKEALKKQEVKFIKEFGVSPTFKGGIHLGDVTTGNIGALKKEIFYTGDVLNTTSRIQGLCNQYKTDLIISETLNEGLRLENENSILLGKVSLTGRLEQINIYSITKKTTIK
jgi:adenylate cyclase